MNLPRETLLAVDALAVHYGATMALQGVSLELQAGEIHAVVGENGAGKSTLLRVLAGHTAATSGNIRRQPDTRISWVPQETDLPADLTPTEWIFLGAERRSAWGWLDKKAMLGDARDILRRVGCAALPGARLGELPLAQRKQIQIARAVREQPNLLLVDEPTAVLGEAETHSLFATLRDLRRNGAGIVYISHHLDEVVALADRVSVLRDGKKVSTDRLDQVDIPTLVHRMVGRQIELRPRAAVVQGPAVLRISQLRVAHVRDVSLTVHSGEIVGLAGLVGAGRSEVLEAVAGLRPVDAGAVECSVRPVLLPEDRALKGLVPTLNLRENLFLPPESWRIGGRRELDQARLWVQDLRIRAGGADAAIDSLSGGNQQKLLLARALRHESPVLLLDEPTAGVDIGAKADIHQVIRRQADDGAAVLIASSDLPELLHLCDRIIALRLGRVAGVVAHAEATEARVGALITGGHDGHAHT
jgi:ABC-type sugar transport system ATPase subunit